MIPKRILLLASLFLTIIAPATFAQDSAPAATLIKNVNIWDGTSDSLSMNANVLVENNLITAVGLSITPPEGAQGIDGGGRTLMPGLIDMHSHLCLGPGLTFFRDGYDQTAAGAYTGVTMLDYLDQGFTTVRDAGCNILAVAKAVNNGVIQCHRLRI